MGSAVRPYLVAMVGSAMGVKGGRVRAAMEAMVAEVVAGAAGAWAAAAAVAVAGR